MTDAAMVARTAIAIPLVTVTEHRMMGAYEIVGRLARGGMAELLLARGVHGDLVVLKRILPHYAKDSRFVELFLDEARLLARLDHPHIAHLVDFGTVDDNYVLAIEYVHGKDLRSTLRRSVQLDEWFPIAFAVQIARDIARALHHAHERRLDGAPLGVVHRDVSPSNIVIAYAGGVKLVDFGVAKTARGSTQTRSGALKGTVQYMSPEQASGAPLDRRSDVFSLGIVLWEMLTMRRLFRADNDLAVVQRILHSRPAPPSLHRVDCPPELDRIVAKALAYAPSARYQTAAELACNLEHLAKRLAAPSSLHAHMHELFEREIGVWHEAQQAGLARLDPASGADFDTTPASEDELSLISIDESVLERTNPYQPDWYVTDHRPAATA